MIDSDLMPRRIRILSYLCAVLLAGCGFEETPEAKQASFVTNVENCACRAIEFEIDSYSGVTFSTMVERCNATVHSANRQRYDASLHHVPTLDSLRCPSEIEEWREIDRLGAAEK